MEKSRAEVVKKLSEISGRMKTNSYDLVEQNDLETLLFGVWDIFAANLKALQNFSKAFLFCGIIKIFIILRWVFCKLYLWKNRILNILNIFVDKDLKVCYNKQIRFWH